MLNYIHVILNRKRHIIYFSLNDGQRNFRKTNFTIKLYYTYRNRSLFCRLFVPTSLFPLEYNRRNVRLILMCKNSNGGFEIILFMQVLRPMQGNDSFSCLDLRAKMMGYINQMNRFIFLDKVNSLSHQYYY